MPLLPVPQSNEVIECCCLMGQYITRLNHLLDGILLHFAEARMLITLLYIYNEIYKQQSDGYHHFENVELLIFCPSLQYHSARSVHRPVIYSYNAKQPLY